jgi:benzoate membrane transport protein
MAALRHACLFSRHNCWYNDSAMLARLQPIGAGLVGVLVGVGGTVVLILQASEQAGIGRAGFESWLFATTLGCGVLGIALSLRYRQPIVIAWSTPGAALLVSTIGGYDYASALGAFVAAGAATALVGATGAFRRLMDRIPPAVTMAVLAGVLLPFGLGLVRAIPDAPVVVLSMVAAYLVLARLGVRAPVLGALVVGLVIVLARGEIAADAVHVDVASAVFTWPRFELGALLALGLPLFALTMTAQNATGMAVLRTHGYEPPIDRILVAVGLGTVLLAPLGSHALNLAALTAAFAAGPEGGQDPRERWKAGVAAGGWYLLVALFAGAAATLFLALPGALIAALAGLGLLGVLAASLGTALAAEPREPALIALLVAASGTTMLGVGSAFWGLVAGLAVAGLSGARPPALRRPGRTTRAAGSEPDDELAAR